MQRANTPTGMKGGRELNIDKTSKKIPSQDGNIWFVMYLCQHVIKILFFAEKKMIKPMQFWYLKLHEHLGHRKRAVVKSRAVLHKHSRMSTHFMFPLQGFVSWKTIMFWGALIKICTFQAKNYYWAFGIYLFKGHLHFHNIFLHFKEAGSTI